MKTCVIAIALTLAWTTGLLAAGKSPFDGTYVSTLDPSNGTPMPGTTAPCPPTQSQSMVFGQGLIVTNGVGDFILGAQPVGWPQFKPNEASGNVSPSGKFAAATATFGVTGQISGPVDTAFGPVRKFSGMLTLKVSGKSCGYQLQYQTVPGAP